MSAREQDLAANLAAVRDRIGAAEAAAGRTPGEVGLVVVTKFFPASDVRILAGLGVTEVGENRHQEAQAKAEECADLRASAGLRWHFIGGLQTNKAAAVARYADVVESVDRPELLSRLDRGAAERGRPLDVLLQVSLDGPGAAHRSGVAPEALADLAGQVAGHDHLRLGGLMAVAPLDADPEEAFTRLAEIRTGFLADHPAATRLSAGMSGDLEQAIRHGATHVRVGSAILGSRPAVK
ncbi:MAG: YggS family pyridoxal phosphate-dependent enzyme [Nocardioides sp.]